MNFSNYSDFLNYMTKEDLEKSGYVDIGRFITKPKTEKEKLQSKVNHLEKKIELLHKEVSIRDQEISILQTKLDEVNSRWYNKLYAFITTLSIRSPFYNR